MAHIIGLISQKGGVGKSTLARLLAREFAAQGWTVKIADLDISQATCAEWCRLRQAFEKTPEVRVETFGRVDQALADADRFDLILLDGAPHATAATMEIARKSDLVVIPSGLAVDDLRPGVVLAHELTDKGVPAQRIVFTFTRVGDSAAALDDARTFVQRAGYEVCAGTMPDRVGYQRALNQGLAPTETQHPSLNKRAEEVAQDIVDRLERAIVREVA